MVGADRYHVSRSSKIETQGGLTSAQALSGGTTLAFSAGAKRSDTVFDIVVRSIRRVSRAVPARGRAGGSQGSNHRPGRGGTSSKRSKRTALSPRNGRP